MSGSDQAGTPPENPHPKVQVRLPPDYWAWTEAQKREWAGEAALRLQEKLLGSRTHAPEPPSEESDAR
jgi:hypothetical protein